MSDRLPIFDILPVLQDALAHHSRVVLAAPPGSGKTTGVPPALLDAPWLGEGRILMLEPRRLAARAAARRMAERLNSKVGMQVGYRTRLDTKVSRDTRIEVVTEGILTRLLQRDPELSGVGLLIFDEFHERSLQADLGLALSLDVQENLRDDLRLLVMSATLQTQRICALLGDAPLIEGGGRSFPVDVSYQEDGSLRGGRIVERVVCVVGRALREQDGDVLVFLPGVAEIRAAAEGLSIWDQRGVRVCPLYGDLPREAQDQAILGDPSGRRRVVLATSIAESSLTIEGIKAVVDSGLARRPRFDPNTGLTSLQTQPVSLAEADQRAGRAGRLGLGTCYRLWSEADQRRLAPAPPAEIMEADLAPLVLDLAAWGVKDPGELRWLDHPPKGACAQAVELLQDLDAIDGEGRITATGRRLAELPMHPRLGHMVLYGKARGAGRLACDLAAFLSERDIVRRSGAPATADVTLRLRFLNFWREEGDAAARRAGIDATACRRVEGVSRQWQRLLSRSPEGETGFPPGAGTLLALAFPDRVAHRRASDSAVYRLASGRAARLSDDDPLTGAAYLACAHLDAGQREGRIYLAAEVAPEEIEAVLAHRIKTTEKVIWNDRMGRVEALGERRLGRLVLASHPLPEAQPERIVTALMVGIRCRGLQCLPWTEEDEQWRARVSCLRQWQPDAGWPEMGDEALLETLEEWLAPWLAGMNRIEQLQRLEMSKILRARLDWPSQQRLAALAPTHLRVPSGSKKRLRYSVDSAPVLSVRLQELFGLQETPTVCEGRVKVLLHLLSPAQRPIQITQDLKGFWSNTYQEVKRELKGRYPKHYWPDDPWEAQPTARVRPGS